MWFSVYLLCGFGQDFVSLGLSPSGQAPWLVRSPARGQDRPVYGRLSLCMLDFQIPVTTGVGASLGSWLGGVNPLAYQSKAAFDWY